MAASYHLPLPKFTLVGATTRAGQLTAPLRDRFGVVLRLELYTPEELARIITRSALILGIEIDPDGALEIASRSRGTILIIIFSIIFVKQRALVILPIFNIAFMQKSTTKNIENKKKNSSEKQS